MTEAAHPALQRAHAAARLVHRPVELPFETFREDVLRLVRERDGDAAPSEESIARRALDDLYLARACEHGCADAWETMRRQYERRLVGLAMKRGARGADSETVVSDLLGDLTLPAPGGAARTLLGTYAGSGSLWAWLAATLVRRLGRRAARAGSSDIDAVPAGRLAVEDPPWRGSVDRETAAALDRALTDAWRLLEVEERAALSLKHHRGLSQRQVARILGVPEYQVSRSVARAVTKLRAAVERTPGLDRHAADSGSGWELLRQVLASRLASSPAGEPLPHEARDGPTGRPHADG